MDDRAATGPRAGQGARPIPAFLVGLCAGAVTAKRWRPVVKSAVKAGIVGTSKLTRSALRCAEDLVDVVHEARSELAQESQVDGDPDGLDTGSGGSLHRLVALGPRRAGLPWKGAAAASAPTPPRRPTS